jgi:cytochrome c oxidase subunit 2
MMAGLNATAGLHEPFSRAHNQAAGTMTNNRDHDSGSAAPAVLLACFLFLLVIATVYIFIARPWPPPPPITSIGAQVDQQYNLTLCVTGAVFILSQIGLGYAVFRFRDRGQRARFIRGSKILEILWTLATAVLFLGLGIVGRKAWAENRLLRPDAGAIEIEVTESQFVFNFRYAGPDGKFGRIDPAQISPSTGNPLGIDQNDRAGRDDIVVPALTVPVNCNIELLIRSQDVVHNFYVRELRLQQDAVPGIVAPVRFTADKIGTYEIVCTQLCGMGHHQMRSFLHVVSRSDYESFLQQHAVSP